MNLLGLLFWNMPGRDLIDGEKSIVKGGRCFCIRKKGKVILVPDRREREK